MIKIENSKHYYLIFGLGSSSLSNNNMMTQFWQTNCSSFHQITETPPLLYEVYLFIQTQRTFNSERCIVIHLDWEFSFERCIVGKDILSLRQQYNMVWNSGEKIPDLIIISLNLIYSKNLYLINKRFAGRIPFIIEIIHVQFHLCLQRAGFVENFSTTITLFCWTLYYTCSKRIIHHFDD